MQAFHGICDVNHLADRRPKREQRHHILPSSPPSQADRRVALAPGRPRKCRVGQPRLRLFLPDRLRLDRA
jgi:hypothetical protein